VLVKENVMENYLEFWWHSFEEGRNGGDGLMGFRRRRILTVGFSTHIGDYR
jgi:hypothetical protein